MIGMGVTFDDDMLRVIYVRGHVRRANRRAFRLDIRDVASIL